MIFALIFVISTIPYVEGACGADVVCHIEKVINKVDNLAGDIADVVTDVATDIPNQITGVANDIAGVATNVANELDGEFTQIGTDIAGGVTVVTDKITDTFAEWFTQFPEAFDAIADGFEQVVGNVPSKKNKLKNNFQSLGTTFEKSVNVNEGSVDMLIDSILDSIAIPDEWLDEMEDIVTFIADKVTALFVDSGIIPSRRRLIPRTKTLHKKPKRRLSGSCNINTGQMCAATEASYGSGTIYRRYMHGIVHPDTSTIDAEKMYSDGEVYTKLHLYTQILIAIRDLAANFLDVLDGCVTLKEYKCTIEVGLRVVKVLLDMGIWVLEFFMNAFDLHDGAVQGSQIEKIFYDQDIIINNQQTIYYQQVKILDEIETIKDGGGSYYAYAEAADELVDTEKHQIVDVNEGTDHDNYKYLNTAQITLLSIGFVLLSGSVLICAMALFIKVHRNNKFITIEKETNVVDDLDNVDVDVNDTAAVNEENSPTSYDCEIEKCETSQKINDTNM